MFKSLDIKSFSIDNETSILDAIQIINNQPENFQFIIVLNSKKQLVGTLTDGDIRRALIKGKTLKGNVSEFMHNKPISAKENESQLFLTLLSKVSTSNPFLPVTDEYGKVTRIITISNKKSLKFNAMIMAGGFGKRLGEKTKINPKALVKLNGKPLIQHVIERLEDAGIENIYISVHYLGNKISKFVNEKFSNKNIYIINEEEPLGTAGALGFLPFTEECNLIVTNCDIITNLNFLAFKNFHVNNNSDCTLAVSNYKHQIPFGVIKFDKNGNYLKIDEKPVLNEFVFSGICCFSANFLK